MNIIKYAFSLLYILFIFFIIAKVVMFIANHIGDRLGFAELFANLFQKKKR